MFRREFLGLLSFLPFCGRFTFSEENDYIKKIAKKAVDRNILCFDSGASSGAYTSRLYKILQEVGYKNSNTLVPASKIKVIYVEPKGLFCNRNIESYMKRVRNIDVITTPLLRKEFDSYGGVLARDDKYLIVAEFDSGEFLAGSY